MCGKNLVHGPKVIEKPNALCKGCLEGKQTHNPFSTQTLYKEKERPELIHVDICGPILPPTPAVENETGVKVKTLQTDSEGEFNLKAFTEYCDNTGLKHHFTAPYSPQQNGVVERRNRSVIEMARSMMKSEPVGSFEAINDEEFQPTLKHTHMVMKASQHQLNHRSPLWVQRVQHQVQQVVVLERGNYDGDVKYFKKQMNKEFKMSDMGLLSYYLGIEVTQHEDAITLKQSAYARRDERGVPVNLTLFRSIIRGLRYLTHTRPDIADAVGVVSRFMEKPTVNHMQAVKRILRYIKGIVEYGLVYTKYRKGDVITGYSDSNHAKDVEDRRSTGGMVFYLKENLVTWGSKKQQCVALSSCEAEFMAATTATCQGIWVSMSKHIDLGYHFIRECVERGEVVIKYVCSKEQRADILTKPLPRIQFIDMRKMMGVKSIRF
uniref:Integrase catalytic domain-containing protein n=1 Tax=Tanacetum cinerariifolium TaxID=118510 RepID=A0A6L2P7B5_TANCI|nr:hypothetical protein [Tanacetum cinerariifolium]